MVNSLKLLHIAVLKRFLTISKTRMVLKDLKFL